AVSAPAGDRQEAAQGRGRLAHHGRGARRPCTKCTIATMSAITIRMWIAPDATWDTGKPSSPGMGSVAARGRRMWVLLSCSSARLAPPACEFPRDLGSRSHARQAADGKPAAPHFVTRVPDCADAASPALRVRVLQSAHTLAHGDRGDLASRNPRTARLAAPPLTISNPSALPAPPVQPTPPRAPPPPP